MKAYIGKFLILGHDNFNIEEYLKYIDLSIHLDDIKTIDIGEWEDDNPLNTEEGIKDFLKKNV
jgi:hypothetical protein